MIRIKNNQCTDKKDKHSISVKNVLCTQAKLYIRALNKLSLIVNNFVGNGRSYPIMQLCFLRSQKCVLIAIK